MPHYMLAVHSTTAPDQHVDESHQAPDPGQMQAMFERIDALEQDMVAAGVWTFSGRLGDPDSATVARHDGSATLLTDGPYVETKEHVAGFYLIEAGDLDDALEWGGRVSECVGQPIEVRPFLATGRVQPFPGSATG